MRPRYGNLSAFREVIAACLQKDWYTHTDAYALVLEEAFEKSKFCGMWMPLDPRKASFDMFYPPPSAPLMKIQ